MALTLCLAIMAIVPLIQCQTQQGGGGMSQCQQNFMNGLYKCVQDSGLDVNNFLYFVTNTTSGQAPSNPDAFKSQTCGKEQEIGICLLKFMNTLANSTACIPQEGQQDQRPMIGQQFVSLGNALDQNCAHPCRATLLASLRQCYVDSDLDPDLFLSNSSMSRGAVIGEHQEEAELFCKNRDPLIACMKKERDICPESPLVLNAVGLDIESMEAGVNILCQHIGVYLTGLDCFVDQTPIVVNCTREQIRKIFVMMQKLDVKNITAEEGETEICHIRIDHVKCDLNGWRKKEHEACNNAVIGLRNEVECELMMDSCKGGSFTSKYKAVCDPTKYCRDCRTGGASSNTFISLLLALPLFVLYWFQ